MVLSDAMPGLRIEGKPQCHIVAIAKEEGEPAASVGCALSRVRTGMHVDRDDVRDPRRRSSPSSWSRSSSTAAADNVVARYAADDAAPLS